MTPLASDNRQDELPGNIDAVNPKIGTGGIGNCLIGPCLPFSLVRLGPDISFPSPNSGYRPRKSIAGFSHTRLAGTGGCPRYGNLRFMPFIGEPRRLKAAPFIALPVTDSRWSVPVDEFSEPGLYRCRLPFGVDVELTSTRQAGVHRYRFTEPGKRCVLLDFASLLQGRAAPAGQVPFCEDWEMEAISLDGRVTVLNDTEIEGYSEVLGGWGHFEPYTVHFFVRLSESFAECELFRTQGPVHGISGEGAGLRAMLTLPDSCSEITIEAGISFTSIELAREAVKTESAGQTVEVVREKAREAWTPWLDRVRVKGGTPDQRALFATSLYHLFTLPTDLSSDGQVTADGGPVFTDITCLWDSIRNANSLLHLIAPELSRDLMNSILDFADETGWLYDAHISGHAAYQQSGCCAEILFSEAARKGVPGVDYRRALAACIRNAETPTPDPYIFGRFLEDYERLGYLSTNVKKSCVSRHVEYTFQDWCIARLAEHLGQTGDTARFDAKGRRLWNLWRDDRKAFWPKKPDGQWAHDLDVDHMIPDHWNDPYAYESSLRHWSFSGLQDIPGLIERHGGNAGFVEYLDAYFENHADIEKETRMHIPHLYAFAGRPDRAAERVRLSLANRYTNTENGLPDNEDMGSHSAYYICNAIGLYPIYGHTIYSVVPPLFEEALVQYGLTGKSLHIVREGNGKSIREIRLNGMRLPGTLIEHRDIAEGGQLVITTE